MENPLGEKKITIIMLIKIFRNQKRYCRVGAGHEETSGASDTPGFPFISDDAIEFDNRGFRLLKLKRSVSSRLNQSSMVMLQSWRGNCDVKILLYDTDPLCPDLREIENVSGYVVAYTCKGNITFNQETDILCSAIKRYVFTNFDELNALKLCY